MSNWWIRNKAKVGIAAAILTLLAVAVGMLVWLLGSGLSRSDTADDDGQTNAGPTRSASASPVEPRRVTPTGTASAPAQPADGTCMDPAAVDRTDPDAVAYTMASVSHCWDSMTDTTTTAGAMRGRALMSEKWAAQQVEPERNALQGQFSAAAAHQGYSVPEVSATGSDTNQDVAADKKARGYTTKWKWKGRDGKTLPGGREQVVYYLEKHGGQWEVVGQQVTLTELED